MAWECDRCGELHTQNPKECRNCGNGIFKPVSPSTVRDRSDGIESASAMDGDAVGSAGSVPGTDFGASSPDVAVDGSIADGERDSGESEPEESGEQDGTVARLRRAVSSLF